MKGILDVGKRIESLPGWVQAALLGGVTSLLVYVLFILLVYSGLNLGHGFSKFLQYLSIFLFYVPMTLYHFILGNLPQYMVNIIVGNMVSSHINHIFMVSLYTIFWASIFAATYLLNAKYLELKEGAGGAG